MSIFYKNFLNEAYDRHMEYNRTWWRMNFQQLYPGFKAAFRSLRKRTTCSTNLNASQGFWEKSFES
ncbi:hypothetical protein BDF20DRAFT_854401 [Mycotypha africana]|uniref:uncharacterized protein n=1 Tax=Mycotypha africana TaxID=64632 RepID=UPI002300CDF2|nr:uncharacterized protein BDF20DRAFT_854401 [Mycotypha africana]KAI8988193.1 hypothetical protein BDF20DRAFT_854401 [Mycotypha africana]